MFMFQQILLAATLVRDAVSNRYLDFKSDKQSLKYVPSVLSCHNYVAFLSLLNSLFMFVLMSHS